MGMLMGLAMTIVIETRQAGRVIKERLPVGEPELADALAKLDGDQTTVFTVTVFGNHLFVGGGEGRYTVSTLMEDGRSRARGRSAANRGYGHDDPRWPDRER
jgi:hypothetical protein